MSREKDQCRGSGVEWSGKRGEGRLTTGEEQSKREEI